MLIPEILPDEFVLGYRSRLRILNGFADSEQLMAALLPKTRRSISSQTGTAGITAIATLLGMDCTELVRGHSMIPFIRAIAQRDPDQPHGDPAGAQRLVRSGLREIRGAAHHCPACVAEDMDFRGIPYWRRSHQIPGLDWCPKHGHPLVVGERTLFDHLPPVSLSSLGAWNVSEEFDHPVIRRYGEIALGLMDLRNPIHCQKASRVIGQAARNAGLRISPMGKRTLPSDLAKEQLPTGWLTRHFPQVANKAALEYISNFDGACAPRSASYSTNAYVLIAALLYPSADEALFALTHADLCAQLPKSMSRSTLKQDNRRHRQLTKAYIDSDGIHGTAARILTAEAKNISKKLSEIGLPSLSGVNTETRAALLAFLQGASFDQACKEGGLDASTLMDILRTACLPLRSALEAMDSMGSGLKPSVH